MKKTIVICAALFFGFCAFFTACGIDKNSCSHSWGEWVQISAPTCTEKGIETRICSKNSNHIETRILNALGHDLEWVISSSDSNNEIGTCKRDGCNYYLIRLVQNLAFFDPNIPTAEAQNGIYFLTRDGYEAYVRVVSGRNQSDEWIQDELNNKANYESLKEKLAVIINGDLLSLSSSVYQFSRTGNYYNGPRFDTPIFFSFSDDKLNIRLGFYSVGYSLGFLSERRFDLQFERDESVLLTEEPPQQISAPERFTAYSYNLWWASNQLYGILGVRIELQLAGTSMFEPIENMPRNHWAFNSNNSEYRFQFYWSNISYLNEGANTFKVTLLGGPILKDGKIFLTTDSETVTYDVVVNQLNSPTLVAPTDFKVVGNGHWLEWTSDDKMRGNAIYVKRPDGDFEKIVWDFGDGDAIPLPAYTSIASLKLCVGENIVRVISSGNTARFEGGVFTVENDSPPGEFKITVENTAEEQVAPPTKLGILWNELIPGGFIKLYLYSAGKFVLIDSDWWHGATYVDWSDLAVGENTIRVIAMGRRARLESGVLITYIDSDPVDIIVTKDTSGNLSIKE